MDPSISIINGKIVVALGDDIDSSIADLDIIWAVYNYEDCCYDGAGKVIGKYKSGEYFTGDLSHGSCYGPTNDLPGGDNFDTLEDAIKDITPISPSDYDIGFVKSIIKWLAEHGEPGIPSTDPC